MLLTKEELDKAATIDPRVAEFNEKNPRPPQSSDPKDIRDGLKMFEDLIITKLGPPPSDITELFHDIPMRDGYMSSAKIHKPSQGTPGPLIVLIFGGGFVAGSNNQMTGNARALVKLFGATVVDISYRLAPEYRFPYSQHDSIDNVKWLAENATGSLISADPSKGFVIGGASAGGCLAACLSRFFQKEKLPYPLTGQWLGIPAIIESENCPEKYKPYFISREQNAYAPGLNKEAMDNLMNHLQADNMSDLRCAVVSKNPISDQPRTYFEVDGMDPLRDDGLIYEEMLKEAGVPTKIDLYPGCPHGHSMLMMGTELGNQGDVDRIVGFGWLLQKEISQDEARKALGHIKG